MSQASDSDAKPATRLVNAGRRKQWTGPVVNPPIWRGSTHLYEDSAALAQGSANREDGDFFYGRRGAPTQWALAEALTELEPGAHGTVLYPSGVAAIAGALMAVLRPGDVLLLSDSVYDPSRAMANGLLKQFGVDARYFDPLDLDGFSAQFCERTRAVLLESPGSLTLDVHDIPALTAITREQGAVSLIDNTWASALGFAALQHGCDIAIQSLTKHVGGHSDLMMGAATAGEKYYRKLRRTAQALGQVVSPDDAALAARGLRTMGVRLKRETASALEIAAWLSQREEIAHVLCPMLPGAPGHDLWTRDFTGGCGLFSFILRGRDEAARARLVDALQLFGIGYSWGGFESLALPFDPAPKRSATRWPPKHWREQDCLGIRLSIGLEDPADLIADLERGLAAMEKQ